MFDKKQFYTRPHVGATVAVITIGEAECGILFCTIFYIIVRPHTTQNATNIVDAPISDSASKTVRLEQ